MMKLEENRSQIWFKILQADGSTIDGAKEHWSFPSGTLKGKPMSFEHHQALAIDSDSKWSHINDVNGTWLVNDPTKFYSLNSGRRIYVAQLLELPQKEEPGMIWVQKVCLVRLATSLDLRPFGIHRAFNQTLD